MRGEEVVRRVAAINYVIVIAHGVDGGIGFSWQGVFIHDPFVDPQYGAFAVDPDQQYGDAFRKSTFATDPAKALEMAQQQLRDRTSDGLSRYCADRGLHGDGIIAIIEEFSGALVSNASKPLDVLTDEQVAAVWANVDGEMR